MKKKWFFISTSLKGGGAERVLAGLSSSLSVSGCEVVVYLIDGGAIEYDIPNDVKVVFFPFWRVSKGFLRFLFIPLQAFYLLKYRRYIKDACVLSFMHRGNIVNSIASKILKYPLIISERSIFDESYSGLKKVVMRYVLNKSYSIAKGAIAISTKVKSELVKLGVDDSKIVVISNPLCLVSRYEESDAGKYFNKYDGKFKLLTVGRLIHSKNVDVIIESLKFIREKGVDAVLIIAGQGVEFKRLKKMVENYELDEYVDFLGFVRDVSFCYKTADVFICASSYESFGNVLIEASAYGLPVFLPSTLPSLWDIYPNHNCGAVVYKKIHPEEIANSIKSFYMNGDLYKKKICADGVENSKRFEKNKIFYEYECFVNGFYY